MRGTPALAASFVLLPLTAWAALTYTQSLDQWRQQREAKLKAEDGWLSLAGLVWLREGANTVGRDANSAVRLARGPAKAGVIEYHAGRATWKPAAGAGMPLKSDAGDAKPDLVRVDDITWFVIHRGERDAVRVKDPRSEARTHFTGLHWYPVRPEYRIEAKWVPHTPPITLAIPNIMGETEKRPSPGHVEFPLLGKTIRLDAVIEDGDLFFIFKDQTAGKETYPAGRFLHADLPTDLAKPGKVVVDFNKAYNPPCAFTPYATCPLPPPQNKLALRLEVGELNYGQH